MNEGIGNHLHLFHIANDFTCLVCYKLLHKFRGANRDAYTFDAVHMNDIVWAIDFCKQGVQTGVCVFVCVCVCVCVCARARARSCVCVRVRARAGQSYCLLHIIT